MSLRRSARSSAQVTKSYNYNEYDSDDEDQKFKQIIGYESGSDFEDEMKHHGYDSEDDNANRKDKYANFK